MAIPLTDGSLLVDVDANHTAVAVADRHGVLTVLSPKAHDVLARAGLDRYRLPAELWDRMVAARPGEAVLFRPTPSDELALSGTRLPLTDGTSLIYLSDVSVARRDQRRRLHQLRLQCVEEVAAMFGPSLREPLSSLLLNADLLAEGPVPDDREVIEDIRSAASLLRDAIDDLFRFAGLQAEPDELASVADAVAEAIYQLRNASHGAAHHVDLEVQPGAERVKMNPRAFQRIVHALLANAFEAAADSAKVRVVAVASTEMPEWPVIRLRVQDDGPGGSG